MDEIDKLRLLDEATATLAKYAYEDCTEAWRRYKSEYQLRELNLGVFVSIVREVQAKRKRETRRQIEIQDIKRDRAWQTAKEECLKQCQLTFGWSDKEFHEVMNQED